MAAEASSTQQRLNKWDTTHSCFLTLGPGFHAFGQGFQHTDEFVLACGHVWRRRNEIFRSSALKLSAQHGDTLLQDFLFGRAGGGRSQLGINI